MCWLCWPHVPRRLSSGCVSQLPSFSSRRNGGVTTTRLVWYCTTLGLTLPACALSVLLLHLLTWESVWRDASLFTKGFGAGLTTQVLPGMLMVHLGVFTLYPLLTIACSCTSVLSLKSSLDYSLFAPWRAGEDFDLDMVVCVWMFEQLMLALTALPPPLQSPPTTPMCLRKLGDCPPSVCKSRFLGL